MIGVFAYCVKDKMEALCKTLQYQLKHKLVLGTDRSLAEHFTNFSQLGQMSIVINIKQLDKGDGTETTLAVHKDGWRKSCRLQFSQTKLEWMQKKSRAVKEKPDLSLTIKTHSSKNSSKDSAFLCIFCDQNAGSEDFTSRTEKRSRVP